MTENKQEYIPADGYTKEFVKYVNNEFCEKYSDYKTNCNKCPIRENCIMLDISDKCDEATRTKEFEMSIVNAVKRYMEQKK